MNRLFQISGFNIYMQVVVTLISILVHLLRTRNIGRKETVLELVCIYTFGLAGWFSMTSGLFGHIL